jgi:hypothetical protein
LVVSCSVIARLAHVALTTHITINLFASPVKLEGAKLCKQVYKNPYYPGADYAFMSTTLDREVAMTYSMGTSTDTASTVLSMTMDSRNRGAFIAFLSQYPDEMEILLPPLTGLEVRADTVEKHHGNDVLVYHMQL